MSFKNLLQEYCQKKSLQLPKYVSLNFGQVHKPVWKSSLNISEQKFSSDEGFKTKSEAEQNIAKISLSTIKKGENIWKKQSCKYNSPSKYEWISLIDIENLQPNINPLKPVKHNIFLSEFSTIDTEKYRDKGVFIYKIDNSNSDAADYLMTFQAAKISSSEKVDNYIILSRDKASAILAHLLQTESKNVKHFKDNKSFESFIDSLPDL